MSILQRRCSVNGNDDIPGEPAGGHAGAVHITSLERSHTCALFLSLIRHPIPLAAARRGRGCGSGRGRDGSRGGCPLAGSRGFSRDLLPDGRGNQGVGGVGVTRPGQRV
jgi:hypothetical protein